MAVFFFINSHFRGDIGEYCGPEAIAIGYIHSAGMFHNFKSAKYITMCIRTGFSQFGCYGNR